MQQENKVRICPGCKTAFPYQEDLAVGNRSGDRYGVSSPECATMFHEVLAREGEWAHGYPAIHRLTVDAYAVQHPPHSKLQKELEISERFVSASIQSIAIHLIALYLAFEKKVDLQSIAPIMDRILANMSKQRIEFEKLTPPEKLGNITIKDVRIATNFQEHSDLVWQWARDAWQAWSAHHETVRGWYKAYKD